MLDLQALEGKDVKDLLLNVGSGGGAAAAPSGGAAASGEAAAEEAKEEEKEEGTRFHCARFADAYTNNFHSQGGVRRGYGLRSLRLSALSQHFCLYFPMHGHGLLTVQMAGRVAFGLGR